MHAFEYVLRQMKVNQVTPSVETLARTFEYSSLTGAFDRANSILLKLASHRNAVDGISLIDNGHL